MPRAGGIRDFSGAARSRVGLMRSNFRCRARNLGRRDLGKAQGNAAPRCARAVSEWEDGGAWRYSYSAARVTAMEKALKTWKYMR